MKTFRFIHCIAASVLISALSAHATPYASEVVNNGGTIQFYLNELPDSVVVTFEDLTTLTLPSPVVGLNSFALGSHTSYAIAVNKVGAGTPTLISSDTATYSSWNSPRGLGINVNPTNGPLFGRIYVANSAAGSKGKGLYILNADQSSEAAGPFTTGIWQASSSSPYRISVANDGEVYAADETAAGATVWQFDPDFALYTNQVLGGLGSTAGTADGIHGQIFGEPVVTGSIAGGNLVLWTADLSMPVDAAGSNTTVGYATAAGDYNNVYRYTIGSGPLPWSNAPDLAVNSQLPGIEGLDEDVDIGTQTGNIYAMNYRNNWGAPNVQIFDPTGMNLLWDSLSSDGGSVNSGPDWFNPAMTAYTTFAQTGSGTQYAMGTVSPFAIKISPDEKYLAVGLVNNPIYIMNLNDGVPNTSTLTIIPNAPNTTGYEDLRALCWDAADNVYASSSGQGLMRTYSLGLTTTCVTSNDSTGLHGSFSISTPNVAASVEATTALASQAGGSYGHYPTAQPAVFTITLNAAQSVPVNISFTLGGTATNGVNYNSSASSVVNFPIGATSETVTITPTANPVSGPTLTVTLNLKSGASYSAVSPSTATAYIANTGPQVLNVGTILYPTMYRGTPGDYAGFQIVRWGDTNVAYTIPASTFSYSGKAGKGTDYTTPVPAISVAAGDAAETNAVVSNPVSTPYPFTYVGNESIIVTMSAGTSPEDVPFTIGPAASATMTLLDNAYPPETVLWSDPLTSASDTGWNLAFGSEATGTSNNPTTTLIRNYVTIPGGGSGAAEDFDVEFGYILANDPLNTIGNPPNGATNALKVTVNKNGTGASGGVSLYPASAGGAPRSFSGNYALRFSELTYEDTGGLATEYTQWGINHQGTNANWWAGDGSSSLPGNTNVDGVWYSLGCEQGGATFGDVLEFTATNFPNAGWVNPGGQSWGNYSAVFKHPPYNSSGTGAFSTGYGNPGTNWNDVELKQFNNVITLTINKTVIFSYTNTTGLWKSGDIMLGYDDPFASVGTAGEAYFSNVRVVSLTAPAITGVSLAGGNVVITFTSNDADAAPSSFAVESSGAVNGAYAAVAATITQSGDVYTATTPFSHTGSKFFVIEQNVIQ